MAKIIYKLTENEEELRGVNEVRRQVFVIEQGIAEELTFEKSGDGDEINIIVKDADSIIGTARAVFLDDCTAKIERMAVLKDYRKRGLGKGIILFLKDVFKRRKITHIILHAQYQVIDFYKACGFQESGPPFNEAGIKHVKMEMQC
jgi:predicted GNAT family N-acyltransferase